MIRDQRLRPLRGDVDANDCSSSINFPSDLSRTRTIHLKVISKQYLIIAGPYRP